MTVLDSVLQIIANEAPQGMSGEQIASELGVSRASVWKAIQKLQDSGYVIEGVRNKGYQLKGECDPLTERGISAQLSPATLEEISLTVLQTTDSTNAHLRKLAEEGAPEYTCVIASQQTAGRGRRGRSFVSLKDTGVYMSILFRPQLPLDQSGLITGAAAVAVCHAIEKATSKKPQVKWVNDVYLEERKICGILTEGVADLETGSLGYAVLGIGINVYAPKDGWPEEISQRATQLTDAIQPNLRNRIAASIIEECMGLCDSEQLQCLVGEYNDYSMMTERKITVLTGRGEEVPAVSVKVNPDLSLQVRYDDGSVASINSGEVSIRL